MSKKWLQWELIQYFISNSFTHFFSLVLKFSVFFFTSFLLFPNLTQLLSISFTVKDFFDVSFHKIKSIEKSFWNDRWFWLKLKWPRLSAMAITYLSASSLSCSSWANLSFSSAVRVSPPPPISENFLIEF